MCRPNQTPRAAGQKTAVDESPKAEDAEPALLKHLIQFTIFLAFGLSGLPAMATEEPKFELLSRHDHIELRRYPAFIVAETFVDGDMDAASGKGFRTIADYIFGNNMSAGSTPAQGPEKIAMTAPVTLEPVKPAAQKIAMTAPVALEPLPESGQVSQGPQAMRGAKRWRVHFVMPSAYTLNTLPKPSNPAVQLREVPAKTWAVLSYSGFNTEAGIQQRTDELVAWLATQKIRTTGSPQLARYNPPWTLPMFRRNEIMLETE
ncbi:heme-binding protein [Polaromonas sp.]|uniref:SOUL family heme-binding protein n=1 Tax=Polaromonas sp. TaxID=1869339 RepID=UPI0024876B3E|nr:heme-binding protein [Polaromonas sp.]MDI1275263.1 heme-binding protein [Polaromonas sp.]